MLILLIDNKTIYYNEKNKIQVKRIMLLLKYFI